MQLPWPVAGWLCHSGQPKPHGWPGLAGLWLCGKLEASNVAGSLLSIAGNENM